MSPIEIGQPAPSFRLPSGQGPTVGLEEYRGRKRVLLWFTKGMGCPFCRSQMSQLARGYDRLQALDAEVLQVTPSTPERATFYLRNFKLPFVYLCDPDYRVHRLWGLDARSHSLVWYARTLYAATKLTLPASDLGTPPASVADLKTNLHDSDMGFFLIDRQGVVRYVLSGPYVSAEHRVHGMPSTDEIVRELERAG
jgi:peroxiredoxin